MSIPAKLLILIGAVLLGIVIGWHVRGNEDAGATLAVQKQEVKQGNLANAKDAASAQQHEQKRAEQQAHDGATAQAAAIAASRPEYHACEVKPEDLRILNDAITGGTP